MLVSLGLQMLLPLILMLVQCWLYFCRHTLQMMHIVPNGRKVSVLSTICCQGKKVRANSWQEMSLNGIQCVPGFFVGPVLVQLVIGYV